MTNNKISNRQLGFILFMMRSTIIIAFLPVLTSADALQDAWISALITLFFSLLFTTLIAFLSKQFPKKTIVEYSQYLLGKWPGRALSLIFLWLFLQLSVIEIRIYGEIINIDFLPDTPLIVIMGIMVLTATISVYKGIKVIGRTADILFFIFFLMILSLLFIPLAGFNGNNLQPILARGWEPAIRGSLVPIAMISQVWVIGVITPDILNPEKIIKTSCIAIGSSIGLLVVFSLLTIGNLGAFRGSRSVYPVFSLIRSIEISQFLERAELLIIFAWGMGHFITVSTYLYVGSKSLYQLLDLDNYNSLIWPMAVFWILVTTAGFENMFELNKFLSPKIYAPYGGLFLVIPLLTLFLGYLFYKLRGKGEKNKN